MADAVTLEEAQKLMAQANRILGGRPGVRIVSMEQGFLDFCDRQQKPANLMSADAAVQAKKRKLRRALADAGFTWPTVTPAGDAEWEHFVFECELCDGEV